MLSAQYTTCYKCRNPISISFFFRDDLGWMCPSCAPKMVPCRAVKSGCTFMDFPAKRLKHEMYFCHYAEICTNCTKKSTLCLIENFGGLSCKAGESFPVYRDAPNTHIVLTEYGHLVVSSQLTKTLINVNILTTITSNWLHTFMCSLEILDPVQHTEFGYSLTHEIYNQPRDWNYSMKLKKIPDWSGSLELKVDISTI